MTKKDDVFAPLDKPVFGPLPGADQESGREATMPTEPKQRAPRSDKGKPRPRPAPQTDRAVDHADKVIERMVDLIEKARSAFVLDGQQPGHGSEHANLAFTYLEEAVVVGRGDDLEAWLRSKVYP